MTAWKELPAVQKALALVGAIFIAGVTVAFWISDFRGLPAAVQAVVVRVDTLEASHQREAAKLDRILCYSVMNSRKPADRRYEECIP